jgi:ankyrin repeat protein
MEQLENETINHHHHHDQQGQEQQYSFIEGEGDREKNNLDMLRTLYPSEPELVRLCRAKTWVSAFERSQTHPVEAQPTPLAARGEGSTALSIAVRSRAPLHVLEQLLRANLDQVGVTHFARGSILHDALKHRASDDVLDYLVRAAIHFEKSSTVKSKTCGILACIDELGRTALHYMVDRILRALDRGERNSKSWNILRVMVEAYPDAVSIIDADGTTPLVMLLLIPKFTPDLGGQDPEHEVYCMVKLMLALCPKAVQVSRRLPRPWHYHFNYDNQEPLVQGDGVPTPLSCALLHGRSVETIELLLEANRTIGVKACRTLVTHYREVPLHIAASMRCSTDLLARLVVEDRAVLTVPDIHGLTPLDWIWVRHTLDWCSSSDPFGPLMVSRRRYIHNHFLDWYGRVSNQYLGIDRSMDESPNLAVRDLSIRLKNDLCKRMSIILPEMAVQLYRDHNQDSMMMMIDEDDHASDFPLVHAAAYVPCPLAMVKLACETCPQALWTLDHRRQRLPLHYAATRGGYTAQYPLGVSSNIHKMQEVAPLQLILAKFPRAARVTDDNDQLALHIAIDHAKATKHAHRQQLQESVMEAPDGSTAGGSSSGMDREGIDCHGQQPGHQELGALLQVYPEALQRRDGITKLFPFQQAAVGHDGDVEMAFMLLRRDPSLVRVTIHNG